MSRDMPEWDSEDTRQLLDRIRGEDPIALEELLARDRDMIRGIVLLRFDLELRAQYDVSDIIQEAQLQIARRMADYLQRRPMPYQVWVRRTTLETVLQLRRHQSAARRNPQAGRILPQHSSLLLIQQMIDPAPGPLQRLELSEVHEQIQKAVSQLSSMDQEILLMRTIERLGNDEVAQILGLNPGTASKRFGRALLNLRGLVQQLFSEG